MTARRKMLTCAALLTALTLLLSGCGSPNVLTVTDEGIEKSVTLGENEPTPINSYIMTAEDIAALCAHEHPLDMPRSLSTEKEHYGISILRQSPDNLYYAIFNTELGGRLYLFFFGSVYVDHRDEVQLSQWSDAHQLRFIAAFYIERRLSHADFESITAGMTEKEVNALIPEMAWNKDHTFNTAKYLLSDGVIEILYHDATETEPARVYLVEYSEEYQDTWSTSYWGSDKVPLSYRIWDVDYPTDSHS